MEPDVTSNNYSTDRDPQTPTGEEHRNSYRTDSGESRSGRNLVEMLLDLTTILDKFTSLPQQFGQVVTYEDVIAWFVEKRPPDDVARSGAVLRNRGWGRRVEVVQLFLDKHNEPVRMVSGDFLARRITAPGLDRELDRAFGGQDLIIVE